MPSIRTLSTTMVPALALLGLWGTTADAQHAAVQWRGDYAAARNESIASNRPMFLDFGFDGCPWCRKLDTETLRDPSVVGLLNARYVPLKIDAMDSRNQGLIRSLGISGYPTTVLIAPSGQVLSIRPGFIDAREAYAMLTGGLQRSGGSGTGQ